MQEGTQGAAQDRVCERYQQMLRRESMLEPMERSGTRVGRRLNRFENDGGAGHPDKPFGMIESFDRASRPGNRARQMVELCGGTAEHDYPGTAQRVG